MNTRSHSPGFTLLELVIASVLLAVMLFAVTTLSLSGAEASDLSRRLARASEVAQSTVDSMRLELVSSVRVFGNDAEGNGNLARLDLVGAPTPLAGLRLPTIDANGTIRADTTGNEITGNCLLFCKLAWSDRFVCTSTNEYLVDVVRWVYYYPTPESGGPTFGSPLGLNLVRVISEPMVDGAGVDRILDPVDQAEVLLHLATGTPDASGISRVPCEMVWRRGDDPSVVGTFRQIDDSDGSLSDTPIGGTGRANPFVVERRDSNISGVLYYRHHSVATNFARPSMGVGTFGLMSNSGSGFPHGFELQVTGPSSARQIMVHLVVASTNRRGHTAWSNVQVVVDARDL